jgi:hypothetical protein
MQAVVYAAVITRTVDARAYFALRSSYRSRPDCIYGYDRETGIFVHDRKSSLHSHDAHFEKDVGHYSYYRNARGLMSADFRYFGAAAPWIAPRLTQLAML